jgi:hypothetical protein
MLALPPRDLSAYHSLKPHLDHALQSKDFAKALNLCQAQLTQCLTPEALIALHIVLHGLNWQGYAQRVRHLGWLCFPSRFLVAEKPTLSTETEAPLWLKEWLDPAVSPQVSICMIVRNAADTLLSSLESTQTLADEFIIVDTGSSDQTRELAQKFSANLHLLEITWADDFAAARNVSLDAASGDWILILDADEILKKSSIDFLSAFFTYGPMGWNIFVVHQWQLSDTPGLIHHTQLGRLFRRDPALRFHGPLHEQLHNFNPPWYLQIIYLPQVIVEHSGQLNEQVEKHKKRSRNQILERALKEPQYNTPYYWFQKAHVLLYQTQPPDLGGALPLLEQALQVSVARKDLLPPSAHWAGAPINLNFYYLLECLFWQRNLAKMAQVALQYRHCNQLAESRSLAGWALAKTQNFELAEPILTGFFQPGLSAVHGQLKVYYARVLEGLLDCYLAQKEGWLALVQVQKLMQIVPDPALKVIQADLFAILQSSEQCLAQDLKQQLSQTDIETQTSQWLKYAFVLLSLKPCLEIVSAASERLNQLAYRQLSQYLVQTGQNHFKTIWKKSSEPKHWQAEPPMDVLPGQWQWYQILK